MSQDQMPRSFRQWIEFIGTLILVPALWFVVVLMAWFAWLWLMEGWRP